MTRDGASDTDFVFPFGAGLKMFLGRYGPVLNVIDHLVVDHFLSGGNEHDVHATAGVLVSC